MSKDREKEIRHQIYVDNEIIKEKKKEIKRLNLELQSLQGQKRLNKNNSNVSKRK